MGSICVCIWRNDLHHKPNKKNFNRIKIYIYIYYNIFIAKLGYLQTNLQLATAIRGIRNG